MKILIILGMTKDLFVIPVFSDVHPARGLFERAEEEIFALKFDKAYGSLLAITEQHADSPYEQKAIVMKNIISLGQAFSSLRLYWAYSEGSSLYEGKEKKVRDLSPLSLLRAYRSEYLKRTRIWANRLEKSAKESPKISGPVEIRIKYPGAAQLPRFVRRGIDTIEVIKRGIPPTPSQAQNIDESEGYAGVLSAIHLCMEKDFRIPQKTVLIRGKVLPKLLSFYSELWLKKVSSVINDNGKVEALGTFPMAFLPRPL